MLGLPFPVPRLRAWGESRFRSLTALERVMTLVIVSLAGVLAISCFVWRLSLSMIRSLRDHHRLLGRKVDSLEALRDFQQRKEKLFPEIERLKKTTASIAWWKEVSFYSFKLTNICAWLLALAIFWSIVL